MKFFDKKNVKKMTNFKFLSNLNFHIGQKIIQNKHYIAT